MAITNHGTAVACSRTSCRNLTRDPSGTCHVHRGGPRVRVPLPPDPPRGITVLAPRRGVRELFRDLLSTAKSTKIDEVDAITGAETVFYRRRGVLHRLGGHALERRNGYGELEERGFYVDGLAHRSDGPAVTKYGPNEVVSEETYFERGKPHRVGGPAETRYLSNGTPFEETYYRSGLLSRIDGPAVVREGNTSYHFEGRYLASPAEVGAALRDVGDPARRAKHFAGTAYAPLLDEGHTPEEMARVLAEGVTTPDGIREVLGGAPVEWVRSYEESATS